MSAPAEIKSCCVSGHIHSGTPKGNEQTLHGLPTYVATPEGDKKATVVFLTDIFGYALPNVRLLADEWAAKGYYVLVPDVLNGDPISHDMLNVIVPNLRVQETLSVVDKAANGVKMAATFGPWAVKHRDAVSKPIIGDFLKAVKAESSKLVTVGFCWGGRHAVLSAHADGHADIAVAYHPSGVSIPGELEAITKPTFIGVGDKDDMLPMTQVEEAIKIFAERQNNEIKVYPQAVHGFAVRGDLENKDEKDIKESAAEDAFAFLEKHL